MGRRGGGGRNEKLSGGQEVDNPQVRYYRQFSLGENLRNVRVWWKKRVESIWIIRPLSVFLFIGYFVSTIMNLYASKPIETLKD
jgi:hypothetical protein